VIESQGGKEKKVSRRGGEKLKKKLHSKTKYILRGKNDRRSIAHGVSSDFHYL